MDDQRIDAEILTLGGEIQGKMAGRVPGLFDRERWEGRLLDAAMRDPDFKTDLFRFVDVLPTLTRSEQVSSHVEEYLLREGRNLGGLLGAAVHAASLRAASGVVARVVRRGVEAMARRFIAGANAEEALPTLRALRDKGMGFTVDLLGETTLGDGEAEVCQTRYLALIDNLPLPVALWPEDDVLDRGHLGPLPRVSVSVKASSLAPHLDPADVPGGVARLKARLLPLAVRAKETGGALHIDVEQSDLHDITFALFEEAAAHRSLRNWPHLGMTVQAYRLSARADLERLEAVARSRGCPIGVRLVKGAYWDSEVVRARQGGYPCPVFTKKGASDASFEGLSAKMLDAAEWLQPAFASHNLRSLAHALVYARARGLPRAALEIQTLFGMAEPERAALRALGYRVRVYSPVGDLLPGMAYLVRRLLENTSNEGFLRRAHRERTDLHALLARPGTAPPSTTPEAAAEAEGEFHNCPLWDFAEASRREEFLSAVVSARRELPVSVPVVIGGRARHGRETMANVCPGHRDQVAALVTLATIEEADRAIEDAAAAWPAWRSRPLAERVAVLREVALGLEKDRTRLAALETLEVAKPWAEADADVAEAADFCRYYAAQALEELADRKLGRAPGEENRLFYEGVGPAVVIAPWNFPLAIPTGMIAAALVAGNTVVFKPAEQSSATGFALYQHLVAAGVPPGAIQFVPGVGEVVGERLARDPRTAIIAFTGSKAVGLGLWEAAGKTVPGQREVKRVICEMGGKNAVIVDESADLDAAVLGVVQSAFGYAGQKCSACSRVITVGDVHTPFLARLVDSVRSLTVGPADDPSFQLGPVVDGQAQERLRAVLADPGPGAALVFRGDAPAGGHYVPPAIFEVESPTHRLMQEELFGPVLAVYRAEGFEQALEAARAAEYALTGSVYSRTPSRLAEACRTFRVGNLYLNRGCTGAKVGRQPFGGFGMSGAGTKAGGPGYLLRFANPRCVTENTVRRGFAPDLESK